MGLRERFARWLLGPILSKQVEGGLPFVPRSQDGRPIYKEWDTERAVRYGLKASVWVFAAIRRIASSASTVPWYVEELQGDGSWERAEGHPLEVLLDKPNPHMSGQDMRERAIYHLWLGGNAVWHTPLARGMPVEIWPLVPHRVRPVPDRRAFISRYEFEDSGHWVPVDAAEIVHMQFVDPSNPYWGLSPLQAAAKVVDTDVEAVNWNKVALQKRAIKDGVLYPDRPLTEEQWKQARRQLQEQVYGPENARGILLMSTPGRFEPMSMTSAELDFINSREFNRQEIAAAMGIPVILLTGEGTWRNFEHARRMLWQEVNIPLLDDIAEALNAALVPYWDPESRRPGVQPRLRIVYDTSNVEALHENFGEKVKNAQVLVNLGFPLNQVNQRLELGFDDVPWGDEPSPRFQAGQSLPVVDIASRGAKALGWTEEQKASFWKAKDADRRQWEERIGGEVAKHFVAEGKAVVKAFRAQGLLGADGAIVEAAEDMEGIMIAGYTATMEYFGQQEIDRLVGGQSSATGPGERKRIIFDPFDPIVQQLIRRIAGRKVTLMTLTTRKIISEIIDQGMREDRTVDETAEAIEAMYERWARPPEDSEIDEPRAWTIARTEMGTAANTATYHGAARVADETGLTIVKTWISSRDSRVRDSHEEVDGETVPLEQVFSNGLRHPLDPDGEAEEVILCRCAMATTVDR